MHAGSLETFGNGWANNGILSVNVCVTQITEGKAGQVKASRF